MQSYNYSNLMEKGLINSYLNVNAAMLTWHIVIGAQETLSTGCIYMLYLSKWQRVLKQYKTVKQDKVAVN